MPVAVPGPGAAETSLQPWQGRGRGVHFTSNHHRSGTQRAQRQGEGCAHIHFPDSTREPYTAVIAMVSTPQTGKLRHREVVARQGHEARTWWSWASSPGARAAELTSLTAARWGQVGAQGKDRTCPGVRGSCAGWQVGLLGGEDSMTAASVGRLGCGQGCQRCCQASRAAPPREAWV